MASMINPDQNVQSTPARGFREWSIGPFRFELYEDLAWHRREGDPSGSYRYKLVAACGDGPPGQVGFDTIPQAQEYAQALAGTVLEPAPITGGAPESSILPTIDGDGLTEAECRRLAAVVARVHAIYRRDVADASLEEIRLVTERAAGDTLRAVLRDRPRAVDPLPGFSGDTNDGRRGAMRLLQRLRAGDGPEVRPGGAAPPRMAGHRGMRVLLRFGAVRGRVEAPPRAETAPRLTDTPFRIFWERAMSYELARVTGDDFEHAGDFETNEQAYAAALEFGPGEYVGTRDMNGGHYEEEIRVTEQNNVLVRNAGESEWSEWG